MRRLTFASISHADKLVYVLDTNNWDYSQSWRLSPKMRQYATLGDGTIAHSPDSNIAPDKLMDYLFSLAEAMLADGEDAEKLRSEAHMLLRGSAWMPSAEVIAFAESIRFKDDGKRRWYSLEQRKVTTSESRRHDKRYDEVLAWMDGSYNAIFRILVQEYMDGLESFVLMHTVREYMQQVHHNYNGTTMEMLKWPISAYGDGCDLDAAFSACVSVLAAYDGLGRARRLIGWRREQMAREATAKAEAEQAG